MTMAEYRIEPFVFFVVERLGNLLIREAKFLRGVRGKVQQMQIELNRMQCFLQDADARREEGDARVRNWVAEIREAAYDAEDVIETYVIKIVFRRRTDVLNVLMRYSVPLYKVGLKIESINTKISNITTSLQTYGITDTREGESSSSEYERQRQLRQSYPHFIEEDIVGLDESLKTIVEQLVKEERDCRVVSIWGMGGLGKTTLAKMVYNHSEIRRHFGCVAWAYISQQFNTREVLEDILIKLKAASQDERKEIKEMKHPELLEKLYQVQSRNRCLVILDDIWEDKAWYSLRHGFPETEVGSKILLTTRNMDIALRVDQQPFLYALSHLTEVESWELFEKKTRRRRKEFRLSQKMVELGKEMVKHCGGLPLAIVVLGGLLGTKNTLKEWEVICRNVSHYISKEKDSGGVSVRDILALSYRNLPYNLKACFLCLSHLPEDHGIRPEKLVQMWMAEGIVSSLLPTQVGEEETMLDVGMSYLGELVQRSMIQVQFTRFSRRAKICRLHDLMRELCMLKAKEENFFELVHLEASNHQLMWADSASSSSSFPSPLYTIRRIAVYYLGDNIDSTRRAHFNPLRGYEVTNHHIRSCQFYLFGNKMEGFGWQQIESLFRSFKLLRFLDLEGIVISGAKYMWLKAIGHLIHLRYLSIRDSNIEELPSSIGNFAFLHTLDLRVRGALRIPNVLWKLEELRHLYLPTRDIMFDSQPKLRTDGLTKLETLEGFKEGYFDVRLFPRLAYLRKVVIGLVDPKVLAVILKYSFLRNSNRRLRYSSFRIRGDFETKEEQSLISQLFGCHHLHKLHLNGSMNLAKLPDQIPPNLTKLTLGGSKLVEDPMPTLEKFPNLRSLTLDSESYLGKKMVCSAPTPTPTAPSSSSGGGHACHGGFPQLKYLCLWYIPNLEEWMVKEGAMPSLLHLEIRSCPKVKEIPDGLRFITCLRELEIQGASQLRDKLREGGEDFYKVQHVPSITFC